MRKICLINNYNYEKYIGFCVDSALNQSETFDKIFIVDDGSTDLSKIILREFSNRDSRITIFEKNNGGQLSCLNWVVDYLTEDDLIFLLDADDYYPPDYLYNFIRIHSKHRADMYFAEIKIFTNEDDVPVSSSLNDEPIIKIPASGHLTQFIKCWVGNPTSSMVVTGKLYRNIFPYPHEADWITRADDVLVFASSLAGYSKIYIPSLCVGYRAHGNNSFFGKSFSKEYLTKRNLSILRLFFWCYEKYSISPSPSLTLALIEYQGARNYFRAVCKLKKSYIFFKYIVALIRYYVLAVRPNCSTI